MKKTLYKRIGELISEKKYTTKDLGITSRQMNYWKDRDIIPFLVKERKALMTLPEALWILIINELSSIGITTDKLETLSESIWVKPLFSTYADEVLKEAIKDTKKEFSLEEREWFQNFLNDEIMMHHVYRRDITPFKDTIKNCLKSNRQNASFIYCPKTEEFRFSYSGNDINNELNNLFYRETLITIPYFPHLSKLIGLDFERNKNELNYLTEIENKIRNLLIFDRPKLLEIVVDEKGESKIFKITESHKKGEELAAFFLNTKLPIGAKINVDTRSQNNYKVTIKS